MSETPDNHRTGLAALPKPVKVIGIVLATLIGGPIVYMLVHSLWLSVLAPLFAGIAGMVGWLAGPTPGTVAAAEHASNLGVIGGLLFFYLFVAAVIYGILTLFKVSRGWKIAVALCLPIVLLLLSLRPKREEAVYYVAVEDKSWF